MFNPGFQCCRHIRRSYHHNQPNPLDCDQGRDPAIGLKHICCLNIPIAGDGNEYPSCKILQSSLTGVGEKPCHVFVPIALFKLLRKRGRQTSNGPTEETQGHRLADESPVNCIKTYAVYYSIYCMCECVSAHIDAHPEEYKGVGLTKTEESWCWRCSKLELMRLTLGRADAA